jgi:NADPH-dependent curcumin reductase CurA
MAQGINRRFVLASRPVDQPTEANFRMVEAPIPKPAPNQVLVRAHYVSVDPYMRIRMSEDPSYADPQRLGEVMVGGVVGQVIASNVPSISAGEFVEGELGWQEYAATDAASLRKVDPALAPISTALGVLGMPGMTAYFALLEIGRPKPGDTVVVSAAAGAVGQVVGQIAKLAGCRTVGIAGSDAKLSILRERMGFDATINYKTEPDLSGVVAKFCPHGIDIYFDSVGGDVSQSVFKHMALWGRVVLCGLMAQYSLAKPDIGARDMRRLLYHRVRLEGFQTEDWRDRYPEAIRRMAGWIKDGKLHYTETITEGFENTPAAFVAMMRGDNLGKALIKAADSN